MSQSLACVKNNGMHSCVMLGLYKMLGLHNGSDNAGTCEKLTLALTPFF